MGIETSSALYSTTDGEGLGLKNKDLGVLGTLIAAAIVTRMSACRIQGLLHFQIDVLPQQTRIRVLKRMPSSLAGLDTNVRYMYYIYDKRNRT